MNDKRYEKIEILNNLVGNITEETAKLMFERLECFLHSSISVFIPATGQCPFAITPNHVHPSYSFIYYLQPVSDFIAEGKHYSFPLIDGKCLSAMSPNIKHQEVASDFFQSYIAIVIQKDLFEKILLKYTDSVPVFKGEAFSPSSELIGMIRTFMIESQKYEKSELLDSMAEMIAHMVARSIVPQSLHSDVEFVPNILYDRLEVDRAIAYMNSHMHEKIMLETLAEQVNISQGQFSRVFKEVTGQSPIEFLNMMRLERAKGLLLSCGGNRTIGKTMTEVAGICGFSSSAYFSSSFQKQYGMSPSEYIKTTQLITDN